MSSLNSADAKVKKQSVVIGAYVLTVFKVSLPKNKRLHYPHSTFSIPLIFHSPCFPYSVFRMLHTLHSSFFSSVYDW